MCGGENNTQRLDSDPSFKGCIVCVCPITKHIDSKLKSSCSWSQNRKW